MYIFPLDFLIFLENVLCIVPCSHYCFFYMCYEKLQIATFNLWNLSVLFRFFNNFIFVSSPNDLVAIDSQQDIALVLLGWFWKLDLFIYFFFLQNPKTFLTKVSTRYRFYLPLQYRNSCCVCQRTRYISVMTLADCEWQGHLLFKLGNVFMLMEILYTAISGRGDSLSERRNIQ